MNARERFLAACRNEDVDRPPVWLMRQAGRYLPEYRALRQENPFWQMMRQPELAVKVTRQPVDRFGVDAAILFSDILIVLDALGAEVHYKKGGPVISPLVRDEAGLTRLHEVDADRAFDYVTAAVSALTKALHPKTAVIGFSGGPFTLASYLIEKGPSKDLRRLKDLARKRPELYREVIERIAKVVADLLKLQIRAGVDAVQLFDTWAGKLNRDEYRELALPYTQQVFARLADAGVPLILYVRNAQEHFEAAASSGCSVLSIDDSLDLAEARKRLGPDLALQGNFDPALLKLPVDEIRTRVHRGLDALGGRGHIVNLGQGLTPDTPVAGVGAFVDAVREWSP